VRGRRDIWERLEVEERGVVLTLNSWAVVTPIETAKYTDREGDGGG